MLFKILKGPSSRISTDITPFHEGYAYVTEDGGDFYVDLMVEGKQKRVQINPDEIPSGGKDGQLLTKTATGWEWKDAPADGDMHASTYDPHGKQLDIYKYVDDEIAKMPTPDVSVQITAHNESQDAHPYIRGLIPTKISQLDNDSGYLTKHQDISGKLDKPANDATATAGQLLTKTADGQEWQDREKDVLNVTLTGDGLFNPYVSNPAPDEIFAAVQVGKVIELSYDKQTYFCNYILVNAETGETTLRFSYSRISDNGLDIQELTLYRETRNTQWNWNYSFKDTSGYLGFNGNSSDTTVNFTVDSTRTALESGTKLAILMGKIAKWFNDLGWLAFKDTVTTNDVSAAIKSSLSKADSALQSVSKSDVGLGNVANERQYSSANPPPYPVTSVNGKTGAVTVETSSGTTYNATLSSSGWTTSGSYKKQTIAVNGLKANYPVAPVVDVQLTGTDADGDTAVLTGFSAINLIHTAANQLIAYCIGDAPTVNIPLIINTWG